MISEELKLEILKFREDRDWKQFHTPRNLVTAISVEAAELLEPFRWSLLDNDVKIATDRRSELSDEIADLLILLTYLAHDLSIDVEDTVRMKIASNASKYPVDKFRGSSKKYSEL